MRIAIIHDPTSTHASTWRQWLESAHFDVDVIHDDDTFNHAKDIRYDLVIPLITIRDYVDQVNIRMKAVSYFESKGLKLLTPPHAIAASSDKLKTATILHNNKLPHPLTLLADDFTWGHTLSAPLIMKPRFGHSGRSVRLIQSEDEYNKHKQNGMLVQRFIDNATCIRVTCSQFKILEAYKKIPPQGEHIANINRGSTAQTIELTDEMRQLALSAVAALGGGLMGVDILDSPEGLFILETNVPFGFDKSSNELRDNLLALVKEEVAAPSQIP